MNLKLKELRESRNLKISQMVARLGIKDSRYRKWESQSAAIPLEYACACCDILHCTLDELAGRNVSSIRATNQLTNDQRHWLEIYDEIPPTARPTVVAMVEGASGGAAIGARQVRSA